MNSVISPARRGGAGRAWVVAFLLAAVLVVLVGCGGGDSEPPDEEPSDGGAASVREIAEMNYGVFDAFTVEGSGEQVIELPVTALAGIVTATSEGDGEFAIVGRDSGEQNVDLLVKRSGPYSGTTFYSDEVSGKVASLLVSGESWSVTVAPVASAAEFSGSANGTGDTVLLYGATAPELQITHDGLREFAVFMDGNGQGVVVEAVGAYEGSVEVRPGPAVLIVTAAGDWSIATGQ